MKLTVEILKDLAKQGKVPSVVIEDNEFDSSKHERYSNYVAVNVDNIKQIPDTNEIIGVPITFLDKYNPE